MAARRRGHQALVLTPTRELAHQVAEELRQLAQTKGTRILSVYGGVPIGRQCATLKAGIDIIVGTPGRLLDHIRRRNLDLSAIRHVVLDEADEMLSMGFWDDVTELMRKRTRRQANHVVFGNSALRNRSGSGAVLHDPHRIDLSGDDLTVEGIENGIFNVLSDIPKPRQLLYLLETEQPESAIIFCNTRKRNRNDCQVFSAGRVYCGAADWKF
ncbi:MAG: DEAD/DEAH box helicase [Myxococcota bacterium]